MQHQAPRKKRKGFTSPAFDLVYEDNFLLVVNKQAGFLSVPTGDRRRDRKDQRTLVSELRRYLAIKSGRDAGVTPIHRLDRDTSGLLVVAKSPRLAERIKEQFKARKPKREYIAIVRGALAESEGTFRSYLATDEDLNQYSTEDEDEGKLAVTHFRRVAVLNDATQILVTLETGRRNQIRVHFSEVGHPVLGDVRYRPELAAHPLWRAPRLALHAAVLGFVHPMLRKPFRFEAPMPREIAEFLDKAAISTL